METSLAMASVLCHRKWHLSVPRWQLRLSGAATQGWREQEAAPRAQAQRFHPCEQKTTVTCPRGSTDPPRHTHARLGWSPERLAICQGFETANT